MSNELDWELVVLFRARVPGGWLVMLSSPEVAGPSPRAAGLTFVPGTAWASGK
jgi:hypothetical protein